MIIYVVIVWWQLSAFWCSLSLGEVSWFHFWDRECVECSFSGICIPELRSYQIKVARIQGSWWSVLLLLFIMLS